MSIEAIVLNNKVYKENLDGKKVVFNNVPNVSIYLLNYSNNQVNFSQSNGSNLSAGTQYLIAGTVKDVSETEYICLVPKYGVYWWCKYADIKPALEQANISGGVIKDLIYHIFNYPLEMEVA